MVLGPARGIHKLHRSDVARPAGAPECSAPVHPRPVLILTENLTFFRKSDTECEIGVSLEICSLRSLGMVAGVDAEHSDGKGDASWAWSSSTDPLSDFFDAILTRNRF